MGCISIKQEKMRYLDPLGPLQAELLKQQIAEAMLRTKVDEVKPGSKIALEMTQISSQIKSSLKDMMKRINDIKPDGNLDKLTFIGELYKRVQKHINSYHELASSVLYKHTLSRLYSNLVDQSLENSMKSEESTSEGSFSSKSFLFDQKYELQLLIGNVKNRIKALDDHMSLMKSKLDDKQAYTDELHKNLERRSTFKPLGQAQLKARHTLTKSLFNKIYNEVTERKICFKSKSDLILDMAREEDRKLISALSRFKLPRFRSLQINNISEDDSDVKDFLKYSLPEGLEALFFNSVATSPLSICEYTNTIRKAARNFKCINVFNCKVPNEDFCQLVTASKNLNELGFYKCTLMTDLMCDFSDIDTFNLPKLTLQNCGSSTFSDWGFYPNRFKNILKSLGRNDLIRENLETLNIKNSGLNPEFIKATMEESGLG